MGCSCAPLLDLSLQILMSASRGPLVVSRSVPTQLAASSVAAEVDILSTPISGHAQVARECHVMDEECHGDIM